MCNTVGAIIYLILTFFMCLSLFFKFVDFRIGQERIFTNLAKSITVYIMGGIVSIFTTAILYEIVCLIQHIL